MTGSCSKPLGRLTLLAAAALAAVLAGPVLVGPVLAADPEAAPAAAPEATAAPATKADDQSFEIRDPADTPPVNRRSDVDERYDNERQHDAEMYAEEYERQRAEKEQKDKKMLDNMNTLSAPGGPINRDLGAKDAGFPPRAPY